MNESRTARSSIRWDRRTTEEGLTTSPTPSETYEETSRHTLCGMISREAYAILPRLPDQGNHTNLWIMVSIWLSISADRYGSPKQIVSRVLSWTRDVLAYQCTYPSEWKGLGKFSSPQSETLVAEFGPVEFMRAILAILSFYIVLYHHDAALLSLLPLITECEEMLHEWKHSLRAATVQTGEPSNPGRKKTTRVVNLTPQSTMAADMLD